jgi:CHAT domain-containing protein
VLARLLLLLASAFVPTPALATTQGEDPVAVIRQVAHAREVDSLEPLRARWTERLDRDPADPVALLALATIARGSFDDSTAVPLYQRLLDRSEVRTDRYTAFGLIGLGRVFIQQEQLDEAGRLLMQGRVAARSLGDRRGEAEALLYLGNLRAMENATDVAGATFDSALTVLPRGPRDEDLRATLMCRQAMIWFYRGDARVARALPEALALARRAQAPHAQVQCLSTLADDYRVRGREDTAVVLLREAEQILRRVRDWRLLAWNLARRADVQRDIGAFSEARAALQESVAEARRTNYATAEAFALHLLGTVAYSLRDIPTSAQYFDSAFARYVAMDDSTDMMLVRSWQANIARSLGDYARARALTVAAIDYYQRAGSASYTIELWQALADIEILARQWQAAERALDTAAVLVHRHPSGAWGRRTVYLRGRLALRRGDLDEAARDFTDYLATLDSTDHLRRHEARAYLAEVSARRGDLATAERELTAASDELDGWRLTLADHELRMWAFQANASDESDENGSVAYVLGALAMGGRADAVFALAERRRARELVDRLARAEAQAVRGSTTTTAGEVAAAMPDQRTAIVEFVTAALGPPTTALVLTRTPRGALVRAYRLPTADSLVAPIGRLSALVSSAESDADFSAEARGLGRVLLDQILEELDPGVSRLVIIPNGPLHRIPWDALQIADGRYVVERYAVSIAPSAATVASYWRRGGRPVEPEVRLLAFGDPAFPGAPAGGTESGRSLYSSMFAENGGLPRLAQSGREARIVALFAPSAEVRVREEATAAYLKHANLADFRVIHLATHAIVSDRVALRTALALAPGGGEDGFVSPSDLAALRLNADLVVLSACRTAGGVVVDGEGVQGLTAPLLHAGARSVVATQWRILDRRALDMVEPFYDALARGYAVSDALREAKLKGLRRGVAPREWAAFVAVGDPLVQVPLRPPPFNLAWLTMGALGALVLSGLVFRRFYWPAARNRRIGDTVGSSPASSSVRTDHR